MQSHPNGMDEGSLEGQNPKVNYNFCFTNNELNQKQIYELRKFTIKLRKFKL